MTSVLVTPPAVEPLALADMKTVLRVDGDAEDATIEGLLAAARTHVEGLTGRALITQAWRIYLDEWPRSGITRLHPAPVASVDAVTLYDEDGFASLLDPADYDVDTAQAPGRLRLRQRQCPQRAMNGIEIDLTAGYGAEPGNVPAPLRQAIRMLVAFWFEHREAAQLAVVSAPVAHGVAGLVNPYRVLRV